MTYFTRYNDLYWTPNVKIDLLPHKKQDTTKWGSFTWNWLPWEFNYSSKSQSFSSEANGTGCFGQLKIQSFNTMAFLRSQSFPREFNHVLEKKMVLDTLKDSRSNHLIKWLPQEVDHSSRNQSFSFRSKWYWIPVNKSRSNHLIRWFP